MKKRLTKKELEIMKILWDSNKALVASEIANHGEALNINTVHACLRTLLKKEAIKIDGIIYSGTVLARSYSPVITKENYFDDVYNDILGGKKNSMLIRSLIDSETNLSELETLEKIIAEKKKELIKGEKE
nr:BlaI/MecI/CopY family transcriptional regulator [uncultured Mediterraneibacter sp.]